MIGSCLFLREPSQGRIPCKNAARGIGEAFGAGDFGLIMWPGVNSGLLGPHNVLICYICCANQQSARARENQSLQTQRGDKEFRVKSGFLSFARQVTGLQHISLNPMWTSAVLPYRVSKFWVENPYHGSMGIDLLGVFLPSLGPHRMKLLSVHSTFL